MPARPTPVALAAAALLAATVAGCTARAGSSSTADAALADSLTRRISDAYDFGKPDVVGRLMALYPARGPVVSAAAGRITTDPTTLRAEISRFWERVGQNMQQPRFVVGERHLTRLAPDAAVLTVTYSIPHHTPEGAPHTLAGAWTAVFQRQNGTWVIVQEHLSDVPPQPEPAATSGMPAMPGMSDSAHAAHR